MESSSQSQESVDFNLDIFSKWLNENVPPQQTTSPFTPFFQKQTEISNPNLKSKREFLKSCQNRVQLTNQILQGIKTPSQKTNRLELMEQEYDTQNIEKDFEEILQNAPNDEINNMMPIPKRRIINANNNELIRFLLAEKDSIRQRMNQARIMIQQRYVEPENVIMRQIIENPMNKREYEKQQNITINQQVFSTEFKDPYQEIQRKYEQKIQYFDPESFESKKEPVEHQNISSIPSEKISCQIQEMKTGNIQAYLEPLDAEIEIINHLMTQETSKMNLNEKSAQSIDRLDEQ